MKRNYLCLGLLVLATQTFAQTDANFGIVPAPAEIKKTQGVFELDKTTVLVSDDAKNADMLNAFIVTKGGFALREVKSPSGKAIVLTAEGADKLPAEGYKISVNQKGIKVVGKGAGLFYGLQSLMQMMPEKKNDKITLQDVEINDYPRFKYRGLHLDVSRHFFPVSFVKKYIDMMAMYKMNNFHWHLTDDQGWRIEIKKYPKLASVGGTRPGSIAGDYPGKQGNDYQEVKGYYTQDEVKQVVAYAASKYINVVPEIEMPGHASAAIAAYPELSCFPNRDTFISKETPWAGTKKGKLVQQTFGVFDDIFVPSENTFKFLEGVLDEVVPLFPSKYIHIGGDEAPKTYWKESEFCQNLIREKGLKDEHGLQSYFIGRIEKYLNAKGKSIIGWDEILEGGLAPNATVMSWRGEAGGIEAAKQNHNVIMTPSSAGLYIDHKQSISPDEPLSIGGYAPLVKSYQYDPTPKELTEEQKKYIMGVQANLWTEYVATPAKAEYLLLPRLLSLSEIAWSQLDRKNFKNFAEERVPYHLAKFDKMNTNYWVPTPIGIPTDTVNAETTTVTLKAPVNGAKIYYTLDGYRPAETADLYIAHFKIIVPSGTKKVLKTVVVTPGGKRSVMTETIFNNGAPMSETKK